MAVIDSDSLGGGLPNRSAARLGAVASILPIRSGTMNNSGSFTLSLSVEQSGVFNVQQEFTFFVSPQEIQISKPGRLSVYQSLGGMAHIDHNGEGLSSIVIGGITGYSPLLGPPGLVQFNLLRELVDTYYELCQNGFAKQARLDLDINFPDYPGYGSWEVTIKDFTLSRSSQMPLVNKYNLQLIAVSNDKKRTSRVFGALNMASDRSTSQMPVTNTINGTNVTSFFNDKQEALSALVPYGIIFFKLNKDQSLDSVISENFPSQVGSIDFKKTIISLSNLQATSGNLTKGTVIKVPDPSARFFQKNDIDANYSGAQ